MSKNNKPALVNRIAARNRVNTVIDGCPVSLNFPATTDGQAMERAKEILVSSYFDLYCGKEPQKDG